MEFDPGKRYCQNRAPKRKRGKDVSLDPAEEERDFKLSRFVKDVTKFVEEKENAFGGKPKPIISKEKHKISLKKKNTNIKPAPRVGLFQNGVQTQFCTRRVAATREMTARFDESLAEIIGLATNVKPEKCSRRISHAAGCANPSKTHRKSHESPHFESQTSSIDDDVNNPTLLRSPSILDQQRPFVSCEKKESLAELETKLYLEFTRLVTISSVESKSAQFKNQSYAAQVKKELLSIYMQETRENTQESSCASEPQKSSVATSPLALSPVAGSDMSRASGTNVSSFTQINFLSKPLKSAREVLEAIGPGASCHNTCSSPEGLEFRPSPAYQLSPSYQPSPAYQPSLVYQPSPLLPSCSQPTTSRPSMYCHPGLSPHLKYVKSPLPTQAFSPYDYSSMRVFGGMDRRPFNHLNWFLPPVEEDSPEFRYFPRMMF